MLVDSRPSGHMQPISRTLLIFFNRLYLSEKSYFTAKLSKKYREFPYTLWPLTHITSSTICTSGQSGTSFGVMHHYHTESRVHSLGSLLVLYTLWIWRDVP